MSTSPSSTAQVLAEAAARRVSSLQANAVSGAQSMQEYEKRQMFRRLIDPGIFRPNSKEVATETLKTLSMMAENILREPENERYRSFKPENSVIKRRLIEPKGALEYALALGFSPSRVVDFQSYYVFNSNRMTDLRIGAAILKETIERESGKQERAQWDREQQKAAAAMAAQNVKLAFMDDRKRKMARDQRERELREMRETSRGSQSTAVPLSPLPSEELSAASMPGTGRTLAAVEDPDVDQPPPYESDD